MATLGEETSLDISTIITNVTDNNNQFDNTIHQNYPIGTRFKEGYWLVENTKKDISVGLYNPAGSYVLGDVVYDGTNSLVKKVIGLDSSVVPKQPESYTAVDTSFNQTDWVNRYMECVTKPAGVASGRFGNVNVYSKNRSMCISSDGLYVFIGGSPDGAIQKYALGTAWDITTIGAELQSAIPPSTDLAVYDMRINSDGTKLYVVQYATRYVREYTMSTPYDISTLTLTYTHDLGSTITAFNLDIVNNGTFMYLIVKNSSNSNWYIRRLTLGTGWNLSTVNATGDTLTNSDAYAILVSSDGAKCYIHVGVGGLAEFTLSTPWDISTRTWTGKKFETGYVSYVHFFKPDGTELYIGGTEVRQIHLSTAWGLGTAFHALIPFVHTETRGSIEYRHILGVGVNGYTMSVRRSVKIDPTNPHFNNNTSSSEHYSEYNTQVLTSLDSTSLENIPTTVLVDTWVGLTFILRPDALYMRTSVSASIQTETLVGYQLLTLTSPSTDLGFTLIGYTNPYKPFDGTNITPAVSSSPMEYTVTGTDEFNSFTLAKVLASSITYAFILPDTDPNYSLWLDGTGVLSGGNGIVKTATSPIDCKRDANGILSYYPTTRVFYAGMQMPIGSMVEITISNTGDVSLGDFTLNNAIRDSLTNLNFSHGIQDYNDYTPDAFGNISQGTKPKVTLFNITLDILLSNYDYAVSFNESIAGKNVMIDASDSNGADADGATIFSSLTRRVRVTNVTANSIVKDGELYRLAGVTISALEVI